MYDLHLILAAGHKIDTGAIFGTEREGEDAIIQVDAAAAVLAAHGVKVTTVPHELDYVETVKWINARYSGDSHLAIEVHKNAGSKTARRVEVYYAAGDIPDQQRAINLAGHLGAETGLPFMAMPDTLTHVGKLYFCRGTNVPALLYEANFIEQPDNEVEMGKQLGRAVLRYMGVPIKAEQQEEEEDMPDIQEKTGRAMRFSGYDGPIDLVDHQGRARRKMGVCFLKLATDYGVSGTVHVEVIPRNKSVKVIKKDYPVKNRRLKVERLGEGVPGDFLVEITSDVEITAIRDQWFN